ncbi:MAG: ATP synthase F1 subunit delta [Planctomycetaceae bacterium]|nr:ATP synthase F1 subunit delta [Planctomycetaceae bacterium]
MANDQPKSRPDHVLEDPSAKAVAQMYAEAFLDAAGGATSEALNEFTSFVDDVLDRFPDFNRLLTSEVTGREDKLALIERVVAKRATPLFANFLRVLARHERLDLLPLILGEAWLEFEHRSGKRRVTVRSAQALTEAQLNRVRSQLVASLPYEPILLPVVDASLIGGLVIQVGDTVNDGSVRTRLKNLGNRLKEKYVHEIQSGRNRFSHSEGN